MEFEESSRPNKSALKRAAKEIEALARQLAEAGEADLAGLEIPAELRGDIDLARRTREHGARKRQVKHLAALLRQRPEEAEILRQHLQGCSDRHWQEQRLFHHVEAWRDRLCTADQAEAALAELARRAPGLDHRALAKLSRAACHGDKAAARQVFRRLRAVAEALAETVTDKG